MSMNEKIGRSMAMMAVAAMLEDERLLPHGFAAAFNGADGDALDKLREALRKTAAEHDERAEARQEVLGMLTDAALLDLMAAEKSATGEGCSEDTGEEAERRGLVTWSDAPDGEPGTLTEKGLVAKGAHVDEPGLEPGDQEHLDTLLHDLACQWDPEEDDAPPGDSIDQIRELIVHLLGRKDCERYGHLPRVPGDWPEDHVCPRCNDLEVRHDFAIDIVEGSAEDT